MNVSIRPLLTTVVLVATLVPARPALAGPPLLCHPFEIGSASSLPWNGQSSWFDGKADYPLSRLASDTEALLGPSTPILVRMETLRRAAIYASRDPQVAATLLERLTVRTRQTPTPDALALLDVAYATEALRQVTMIGGITGYKDRVDAIREVIRDRDGWSHMKASLAARPDDPALQFAAALIASDKDRGAYLEHVRRARAGAASDTLLARNLHHVSGAR